MHAAEGDAICIPVSPVRRILVELGDAYLQARPPGTAQFLGPIPPIEPDSEDCLTPTINIWKPSTQGLRSSQLRPFSRFLWKLPAGWNPLQVISGPYTYTRHNNMRMKGNPNVNEFIVILSDNLPRGTKHRKSTDGFQFLCEDFRLSWAVDMITNGMYSP